MPKFIDITGARFSRLTVLSRGKNKCSKASWICLCDCGNITNPTTIALNSGKTKSCGCLQREAQSIRITKRNTVHGQNKAGKGMQSATWHSWSSMKKRCQNEKNKNYPNYGGRGIRVCSRWNDFVNFYEDMGDRPAGHTLDRIDVNGHYEPSNCRWATLSQQQLNKRCHAK